MALLSLLNVCKRLGTREVLNDVSFPVESGEVCGVIGGRDAGKRSLLQTVVGNESVDSGSIELEGTEITPVPARKRRELGVVSPLYRPVRGGIRSLFQKQPTVGQLFAAAAPKHWKRSERDSHINHSLESLGLPTTAREQTLEDLSPSMRQRAIFGELILDLSSVKLMVLSEPFKALDYYTRSGYLDFLSDFSKQFGLTILLSDRSGHARAVCSRLVHLENGTVSQIETVDSNADSSSTPGRKAPASVFVSYSRQDKDLTCQIVEYLQSRGISTWFDQRSIPAASHWDHEIQQGLDHCECLVLVLSPHSVKSENVMDEVSYALESSKPVFPLLIEDCDIPYRLRRIQYTDVRIDFTARLDELATTLPITSS